jgi:hypothetical protein
MVTAFTGLAVHRDTSSPSAPLALFTFMMLLAPVTNWEPHGVTLAGYCYAMMHGMKVQIVTPYRVSQLQRYGVTVRGNVTSVYQPLVVTNCFPNAHTNACNFLMYCLLLLHEFSWRLNISLIVS